ncbi:Crp/Fnr family transcriptional regulator [Margalitia sp. FSL K6-0131]|uniref:Crp/Fnr family transcriptional regulator n=1 Tax=Margalitia sp. FSL K6-0131 TaxID=2954604 RepID=UPI0030FAC81C
MIKLRYTWEPYIKYGRKLELDKGSYLYNQQEEGKGFYYLDKGAIKISLLSHEGLERTINYVPEGMLFGEHGVNNEPYLTTACTITSSVIYYFSDQAFEEICNTFPEAITIFTDSLIFKFRTLAEIIAFMNSPVEQQMAHFLIKLVSENGSIPLNQTEFAKYIGASRISVNKTLSKWRKSGIIDFIDNKIFITDMKQLDGIRLKSVDFPYHLDHLLLSSE